jgi:hypothetical protein
MANPIETVARKQPHDKTQVTQADDEPIALDATLLAESVSWIDWLKIPLQVRSPEAIRRAFLNFGWKFSKTPVIFIEDPN